MKKTLITAIICGSAICSFAQQAKWTKVKIANWTYIMDGSKSNQAVGTAFPASDYLPNSSTSTPKRALFMPSPPSGYSKVYANISGSGAFSLVESGADDKLKIVASSGASSKFSVYGISEATALTAFYGTINFEDNAATTSDWVLSLGYHDFAEKAATANRFDNGGGIPTGGDSPEIFSCLKFSVSTTDIKKMKYFYAGESDGKQNYIQFGSMINRGVDNKFELLCNNTDVEHKYVKAGVDYTVASGSYHVWLNDAILSLNEGGHDFKGTKLEKGKSVNSVVLQSNNNKTKGVPSNDGSAVISKLSMQFGM
jgi:hypothetical protein